MRRRHILLAMLLVLPVARRASAQWVGAPPPGFGSLNVSTVASTAGQGDTPGIRVGETLLLHTGIAVGAGADSNVNYQNSDNPGAAPVSSAVTHVMPHLDLTNGGRGSQPELLFNLVLNGDYRQYYSSSVTQDAAAFGVGVGASLDIGAGGPWTGTVFQNFTRDVQASYQPGFNSFNRDIEQAGGRLKWAPGGGRLEEFLTYTFMLDHFENQNLDLVDLISNTIDFRSQFKFLPKTALYVDYSQGFIRYLNSNSGKSDSNPLHATAGLVGLITPKLTLTLTAGYAAGLYQTGPSPSTFVAGAEGAWLIGPFARAKLGYAHDFANSIYGNYYDLDAVTAAWNQQVGRSFMAALNLLWEHRNYHCQPNGPSLRITCFNTMGATGDDRIDNWVGLGVNAHYFPQPWFSAGAVYQLLANVSDFSIPATTMGMQAIKVSFVKHQVMAVLSLTY